MKVLLDCDVLLDVALCRQPFFNASAKLVDWAESHPGNAAVAWHSFSNIAYLTKPLALGFMEELCRFVEIPGTNTLSMKLALGFGMEDIEDAMQVAAAVKFQAQFIATRNLKYYEKSPIKALSPADVLGLL